jgi:hypothetical protein
MTYFERQPTHEHNQLRRIEDGYALAGLKPPTRASDVRAIVEAGAQSVHATAVKLSREAMLSDQDPQEWYEDALAQIAEAQRREALAAAFAANLSAAVRNALPRLAGDAVAVLAPHAAKAAKALAAAAKALPAGDNALSPEAVIAADAGTALTTARKALADLGVYASMFTSAPVQNVHEPALVDALPILDLPTAEVEQIRQSLGENVVTLNEDRLTGTRTIRALAKALKQDTDLALIDVARGAYPGVTIALATPEEHRARRAAVATAYQRRTVANTDGQMVVAR